MCARVSVCERNMLFCKIEWIPSVWQTCFDFYFLSTTQLCFCSAEYCICFLCVRLALKGGVFSTEYIKIEHVSRVTVLRRNKWEKHTPTFFNRLLWMVEIISGIFNTCNMFSILYNTPKNVHATCFEQLKCLASSLSGNSPFSLSSLTFSYRLGAVKFHRLYYRRCWNKKRQSTSIDWNIKDSAIKSVRRVILINLQLKFLHGPIFHSMECNRCINGVTV